MSELMYSEEAVTVAVVLLVAVGAVVLWAGGADAAADEAKAKRARANGLEEKEEAKATGLGKTFKQLKHKKKFQEVVAAARGARGG